MTNPTLSSRIKWIRQFTPKISVVKTSDSPRLLWGHLVWSGGCALWQSWVFHMPPFAHMSRVCISKYHEIALRGPRFPCRKHQRGWNCYRSNLYGLGGVPCDKIEFFTCLHLPKWAGSVYQNTMKLPSEVPDFDEENIRQPQTVIGASCMLWGVCPVTRLNFSRVSIYPNKWGIVQNTPDLSGDETWAKKTVLEVAAVP